MKKKFVLFMSTYFFLMMLDVFLTLVNTPNLADEANPLISVLGFNWTSLLIANVILLMFILICADYTFVRYKTIVIDAKNHKEYISQILYDRPDKFSWTMYKIPKNWRPVFAISGYAIVYAVIIARTIVIIEWLMITFGYKYNIYWNLKDIMPYNRADIVISIIACFFLINYWFLKEYKKSKKLHAAVNYGSGDTNTS